MKFKTPRSFECAGQTFTVSMEEGVATYGNSHGQTHFDDGKIFINPKLPNEDAKAITYYHELVHVLLMTMGRPELNQDEGFVDNLASLLWQAQKTSTY
jgi:Zn-dependent peptidase ImmA (M78 family)